MAHEGEYFKCAGCGAVGEESELPPDPDHECGKDECPYCHATSVILCCFTSQHNAEIEHWDEQTCECCECSPELYGVKI